MAPPSHGNIEAGSHIITDEHVTYPFVACPYHHDVINHIECYVRGHVHTNSIEDFWSCLKYEHSRIALFHDHNEHYDSAIQRAFWRARDDASFKGSHYFTTMVSCKWQDCIPLQAADFVVYENRRNLQNYVDGRELGSQLKQMLKMENFGGSSFILMRPQLEDIRDRVGMEWLKNV